MSIFILAAFAAGAAQNAATAEPMLDGRCEEHRAAGVQPQPVGNGVTAYLRQTANHVWLCFDVPQGSYAPLDLRLEAPRLQRAINLHASAQLGEWDADDPSAAPADSASPLWWKVEGWWANTIVFNGMTDTPQGRRARFRFAEGREIQFSKDRFGRGTWRLSADIMNVAGPDGEMISLRWPSAGTVTLEVR